MKRNPTVEITPPEYREFLVKGVPPATGTLKTLYGVRVIEVSSESYVSEDLRFEASRFVASRDGTGFTGWVVREAMGNGEYSDSIATKREAIIELARWAKQDAEERAARARR